MLNSILVTTGITFMYATPLIFASLGGIFSECSGIINIAIEGIMTVGAFFAATVGYCSNNAWLGLLAAAIAGAIFASLHATTSIFFEADQTISGVALNFISCGFCLFLCRLFFAGSFRTPNLTNKLPKLLNYFLKKTNNVTLAALNSSLDITTLIAILLTFSTWFLLYKTKIGLCIRAVGEHPEAANMSGINVQKTRFLCVLSSGALAGMGGAAMSIAISSNFESTTISGHGFMALAAVIFGKWTPHGATLACLLFGFFQALTILLQNNDKVSPQIIAMLPYLLTIITMLFVKKETAPKALGIPYYYNLR